MNEVEETILLSAEGVEATVSTVGARLLSLRVSGSDLTQPVTATTPLEVYNGVVLAPWPNRIRDGRWSYAGRVQQLDITEPERSTALHGLLCFADYVIVEREADSVTLGARIPPQHGWPFALETSVRYALHPDGITVTHAARNRSDVPAPWAVGAHPYLRVGDHPVDRLTVTVPTATVFVVDGNLNPIDELPTDGRLDDLRAGRIVAEVDLDTAYRLEPLQQRPDGFVVAATLGADDGSRTLLLQNPEWRFVQVFTTLDYRTDDGLIGAVAIEPMTAPPDSLNSGIGLSWIDPGDRWTGSWALRRDRA